MMKSHQKKTNHFRILIISFFVLSTFFVLNGYGHTQVVVDQIAPDDLNLSFTLSAFPGEAISVPEIVELSAWYDFSGADPDAAYDLFARLQVGPGHTLPEWLEVILNVLPSDPPNGPPSTDCGFVPFADIRLSESDAMVVEGMTADCIDPGADPDIALGLTVGVRSGAWDVVRASTIPPFQLVLEIKEQ